MSKSVRWTKSFMLLFLMKFFWNRLLTISANTIDTLVKVLIENNQLIRLDIFHLRLVVSLGSINPHAYKDYDCAERSNSYQSKNTHHYNIKLKRSFYLTLLSMISTTYWCQIIIFYAFTALC